MYTKEKNNFYHQKITSNASDQKALFKVANNLLHKKKANSLPSYESFDQPANRFADCFLQEIETIIDSFTTDTTHDVYDQTEYNVFGGTPLDQFLPISNDDLKKTNFKGKLQMLSPGPCDPILQQSVLLGHERKICQSDSLLKQM